MGVRGRDVSPRPDPLEPPNVVADVGPMHEPCVREIHEVSIDRGPIEIDLETCSDLTMRLRRLGLDEMSEHREPRRSGAKPG
jgi:hypothetical protein